MFYLCLFTFNFSTEPSFSKLFSAVDKAILDKCIRRASIVNVGASFVHEVPFKS